MFRNVLLAALLTVSLQVEGQNSLADDSPKDPRSTREPLVLCSGELVALSCAYAKRTMHDVLLRQRLSPEGWRWVVVDNSHWHAIAAPLHVADTVPAFSSLTLRTTYIHHAFFSIAARAEEILQSYGGQGSGGLEWVLSHELGHIVCNTSNERIAKLAADRIRFGMTDRTQICFMK
jgi:hypothetical protein